MGLNLCAAAPQGTDAMQEVLVVWRKIQESSFQTTSRRGLMAKWGRPTRPVVSTSQDTRTIPGHFKPGAAAAATRNRMQGMGDAFSPFSSSPPPHPPPPLPLTASVRCGCHEGDNRTHNDVGWWG
ncbi:hypothetical protein CEXT_246211 [Caerostris extrusa]|uniref:Uncharacterized protein n=1 Tax=Caerostris extrusa TaxID=172846 RepID=A0AAV4R5L0_CAEEX|nr:hypothetical protein CEXT_246211 [Caerostris extrusa]